MRVAILHNAVAPDAPADERDVLVQVAAVGDALRQLGHDAVAVPVTLDLAALERELQRLRPDAAFNLIESLAGHDRLMFLPTALLDALGLPYTGASTEAIFLTGDKLRAKERLASAVLPTPAWIGPVGAVSDGGRSVGAVADGDRYAMPKSSPSETAPIGQDTFIIKSAWQHASFGMGADSLVRGQDRLALRERIARETRRLGSPCFAEAYIDGREFNLSLLASPAGPQVLPVAEIDFSTYPDGKPRLVDHRAKWDPDSFEYQNTPRTFELRPDDRSLADELAALARQCWGLFGLRGYARVDFRVDHAGRPWILEINANPCLSPDAGFAAALEQCGVGFDEAVGRIIDDANRRSCAGSDACGSPWVAGG